MRHVKHFSIRVLYVTLQSCGKHAYAQNNLTYIVPISLCRPISVYEQATLSRIIYKSTYRSYFRCWQNRRPHNSDEVVWCRWRPPELALLLSRTGAAAPGLRSPPELVVDGEPLVRPWRAVSRRLGCIWRTYSPSSGNNVYGPSAQIPRHDSCSGHTSGCEDTSPLRDIALDPSGGYWPWRRGCWQTLRLQGGPEILTAPWRALVSDPCPVADQYLLSIGKKVTRWCIDDCSQELNSFQHICTTY